MSSAPWPDHLLTLDEWDALPEDKSRRFELVEGLLHMSPKPTSPHQIASWRCCMQLDAAIRPHGWVPVPDVDVVLVESFPPVVRAPDISIVPLELARTGPRRYQACDLRVAIEIASPGSRRTDRVAKMAEYAEAGIPDYWIIDLGESIVLDTHRLVDQTYAPVLYGATGHVAIDVPIPLTLDLDALVP